MSRTRPTIVDVAARAGVSKMAVSLAVNGRPGVSDETRHRVLAAADELGWRPNPTARSLSGARAGAVGLVLRRTVDDLGSDAFYMQLFAGLESELGESGASLVLHVTQSREAELAAYRRLASERRVDGVLLTDLEVDDPRVALVRELGLPAVALGGPADGVPMLAGDDDLATRLVLDHLDALGHRVVARVGGPESRAYAAHRSAAFVAQAAERGMRAHVLSGDATPAFGATATDRLLALGEPPTAIVYETDLRALAGVEAARRSGLRVPDDLSVVSWDGSVLGELVSPTLTTLRRDVIGLGRQAARTLLAVVAGEARGDVVADGRDVSRPRLIVGGSTAVPRT